MILQSKWHSAAPPAYSAAQSRPRRARLTLSSSSKDVLSCGGRRAFCREFPFDRIFFENELNDVGGDRMSRFRNPRIETGAPRLPRHGSEFLTHGEVLDHAQT